MDFDDRLAELAVNVAEIRAALARSDSVEAELRGQLAETRTRAAVAEARLDVERDAARELIAQLRSELAEARRPWWRRWLAS